MIILKSKESNYKLKDLLKKYNEELELLKIECPYCRSHNLIKWGTYKRNIYYKEDGNIVYEEIKIKRIKCKKCKRTHALLIENMIPYKQYLLDVIIAVIKDKKILNKYRFSEDTINKWRKQFNKTFLPYLKTNLRKEKDLVPYINDHIFEVYKDFYTTNKKILMMIKQGIISMCYF